MYAEKIDIEAYDYALPDERIARFPLSDRSLSKLLVYKDAQISESVFDRIGDYMPSGSLMVFNNTKVIKARLIMRKPTGARIEIFCLEPHEPADYERAFSVKNSCVWKCIVGNSKKWKDGPLSLSFEHDGGIVSFTAERAGNEDNYSFISFSWNTDITFGHMLEALGRIPIPPYLGRESEDLDTLRYQTVYSRIEGSVAAPTAGLHFTDNVLASLESKGVSLASVTLHVGAGTFVPVKAEDAREHKMHSEHFVVSRETISMLVENYGRITAVGTTTVRTLESLPALGYRIMRDGSPALEKPVGQWELYDIPAEHSGRALLEELLGYMQRKGLRSVSVATSIMIAPGFSFRVIDALITNFHQPRSTLLLLVSALVGDEWNKIYAYALGNGFRFLSYGDSSILFRKR